MIDRSLEFDADILQEYSEITLICLVNGSMGSLTDNETISIPAPFPKVSLSMALFIPYMRRKGLLLPFSKEPLQELNEQSLQKFQRRMCGSAADYKAFQTVAPQRPVEELKEELAAIQKAILIIATIRFCMAKSHHRKERPYLPAG